MLSLRFIRVRGPKSDAGWFGRTMVYNYHIICGTTATLRRLSLFCIIYFFIFSFVQVQLYSYSIILIVVFGICVVS